MLEKTSDNNTREVYSFIEKVRNNQTFLNLKGSQSTSQQTNNEEKSINQSDVLQEFSRYNEVKTLYNKKIC